MLANSILASLCTWQAYRINAPVPPSAVLAGVNVYAKQGNHLDRSLDYAYVARGWEGSRMAHYRVYSERRFAIGFSWDEPLTSLKNVRYDGMSSKQAEILTCNQRYGNELAWVPYNESNIVENNCIDVGASNSTGERFLLARGVADDTSAKTRGRVPCIFMPNLGFAITHYSDFVTFTDFELLCLDS